MDDSFPIIVGGCHRSGTSLIRRVLDAHSRIHCGPEVKFLRDLYGDYSDDPLAHLRFFATAHSILSESELLDLFGKAFIVLHERAAARAGKLRWADKNPENVIYLASWAHLLGNNWVFVHVARNPLDTIASIKEAQFDKTIPVGMEARIDFYRRYNECGLEFGYKYPERYYRVLYERVITAPEATLFALMEWLGEEFEPMQLDFNELPHERGLEDPKIHRTSEIHPRSIGRWRGLLTEAESAQIEHSLRALWREMDPAGQWAHPPVLGP